MNKDAGVVSAKVKGGKLVLCDASGKDAMPLVREKVAHAVPERSS